MPTFPNVPNVPGVPALPRLPGASAASATVSLLVGDLVNTVFNALFGTQWGIYKDGQPVVIADNVLSFEYRQDWSIADFPIEEGGFKSYDKVQHPFDVRLRYSAAGASTTSFAGAVSAFASAVSLFGGASKVGRQALIDTATSVANSFDLFDAVTPDRIYKNVSIEHLDYRRNAQNGLDLLTLDVWCKEVRVISTQSFTQSASSADTSSVGTVQPTQATTPQQSAVSSVQ